MKYPKVLFAALGIAALVAAPTLIEIFESASSVSDALRDAPIDEKSVGDFLKKQESGGFVEAKPVYLPVSDPLPEEKYARRLSEEEMESLIQLATVIYKKETSMHNDGFHLEAWDNRHAFHAYTKKSAEGKVVLTSISFSMTDKKDMLEGCQFAVELPSREVRDPVRCYGTLPDSQGFRPGYDEKLGVVAKLFEEQLAFWMKYKYKYQEKKPILPE